VSRCGHMVNAPQFDTLSDMDNSTWLTKTREKMHNDQWPAECVRCQETEPNSIRQYALQLHQQTQRPDYLQVGGVLDNVCNTACLSCNETLSTRIGALNGPGFPVYNNLDRFWQLPQDRIVHLDINGGEPSYSKNYKRLLANLPPNLKTLRLNTNCSTVLSELHDIVDRGIEVTVTVSCDGIGPVHELTRWPIPWQEFFNNLMVYKAMPIKINLWTTVSVLNVDDLPNIQAFAREHGIDHSWAYLKHPYELSVDNKDLQITQAYIRKQKLLRGIV
jgi:MoaA/NifB/PqqE/SkfB family radical SAM enzyme